MNTAVCNLSLPKSKIFAILPNVSYVDEDITQVSGSDHSEDSCYKELIMSKNYGSLPNLERPVHKGKFFNVEQPNFQE